MTRRAAEHQAEPTSARRWPDEGLLVEALRRGEEAAFTRLVDRYHGSLVRVASMYVADRSIAEEVVQETWLGVLNGIREFEGRSSLKTWLVRIVSNKAKTRGVRESRQIPISPMVSMDDDEPTVESSCFQQSGFWADHWAQLPQDWAVTPEKLLLAKETGLVIEQAIAGLPQNLRHVIVLRDVEGLDAAEVCEMLSLTEGNQRVLLHRARARVRAALDAYMRTL